MSKLLVDGTYAINIVKLKEIAEKKTTKNIYGLVTETSLTLQRTELLASRISLTERLQTIKTLVVTLLLNQMILSTIPEFPHLHPLDQSTEINLEDPE